MAPLHGDAHRVRQILNNFISNAVKFTHRGTITAGQIGEVCEIDAVVTVAENGFEVLETLDTAQFDLILMDCQMPEMDGFEATRRVRTSPKASVKALPIVGFTAGAMQADQEACLAAGMDDYLSKPAKLESFVRKLGPQLARAFTRHLAS